MAIKDYINVETITLAVAVLTLIVTTCHYLYDKKHDKKELRNLIARKEAHLKSLENTQRWGLEYHVAAQTRVEAELLKAEIEELKKQL